MLRHKVPLNDKEMYYYEDILNKVPNVGYDIECIVSDIANRIGYPDCAYGIYDADIILENGVYYAVWWSGSNAE